MVVLNMVISGREAVEVGMLYVVEMQSQIHMLRNAISCHTVTPTKVERTCDTKFDKQHPIIDLYHWWSECHPSSSYEIVVLLFGGASTCSVQFTRDRLDVCIGSVALDHGRMLLCGHRYVCCISILDQT